MALQIVKTQTITYPEEWIIALTEMPNQSGFSLFEYDISYGKYLGDLVVKFIERNNLAPDLISSHGHTVFHSQKKVLLFN